MRRWPLPPLKGHRKLLRLAASYRRSATIPCEGICRGPAVGIRTASGIRWYAEVRERRRKALAQFLRSGSRPVSAG